MNHLCRFEAYIKEKIRQDISTHVSCFIEDNALIERLNEKDRESNYIAINGPNCSGKTHMLHQLIDQMVDKTSGVLDIQVKYVDNLQIYNEKRVFEDIIIFTKSQHGRHCRKILVIDDYLCFSDLFRSKIDCMLHSFNSIDLFIVVGGRCIDGCMDIDTTHMEPIVCDEVDACENDIIQHLKRNFNETRNIVVLMNNLKILKFMEFPCLDNKYFYYNRLIERVNFSIRMMTYLHGDVGALVDILENKYMNNENIKDVLLITETSLYDLILKNRNEIEKNEIIDERTDKLLKLCSDVKINISNMKMNNEHVNYKLLFKNFILSIKKL